eukprot:6011613-Pyramimonas_sp.AAC.1
MVKSEYAGDEPSNETTLWCSERLPRPDCSVHRRGFPVPFSPPEGFRGAYDYCQRSMQNMPAWETDRLCEQSPIYT